MAGRLKVGGMKAWLAGLAVAVLALVAGAAGVDASDRVPFPMVPKAQAGTECVGEPAEMRRTHMKTLTHGRDVSLRDGARMPAGGFQNCIDCHTVTDTATGKAVPHTDPRHFCSTCHTFTAVQIDCFQCHTSLPSWEAGTPAQR